MFVKITAAGELVGTLCCCCASRILIASLQALSSPPFVGSSFVSDRSEPSSLLHTDRTARSRIDTCFDRAVQKYLWFVSRRVAVPLTACATGLLETVLFANIRFHDTVSRGRLLNRFGKDFEGAAEWSRVSARFAESCVSCFCFFVFSLAGIDSSLSDNFGRSIMFGLSAFTTLVTISIVGGLPFFISAVLLGSLYYRGASPRCPCPAFFDDRAHRQLGLSCKGRLIDADGRTTGADCVFVRWNRCTARRRGTCADWVRRLVQDVRRWVSVW